MHGRLWSGLFAFAAASILNPGYFVACAVSTDDAAKFEYGAEEMTEFALSANDSYALDYNSDDYRLELAIEPERGDSAQIAPAQGRGAFAMTAHACGDRKLFATAAACLDSSSMQVAGKFTLLRTRNGAEETIASDIPVSGSLFAGSLKLTGGLLDLRFEGGRLELNGIYGDSFKLTSWDIQSLLDARR
jgi:hypothetical protein